MLVVAPVIMLVGFFGLMSFLIGGRGTAIKDKKKRE